MFLLSFCCLFRICFALTLSMFFDCKKEEVFEWREEMVMDEVWR